MSTYLKANLIIPGAGKSGTSSLHAYLGQHPDICMSAVKEPMFFSIEVCFDKGFNWYNSLFSSKPEDTKLYGNPNRPFEVLSKTFNAKPDAKFYGESSTTYILSEIAIKRMKEYLNNPKFIIVLRNPIERIYSHYTWLCSLGIETLPFKEAVLSDINTPFDANKPIKGCFKYYLSISKYGSSVERYLQAFGKENVHIVTTEELKNNPLVALNECFTFLGVKKLESISEVKEHITNISAVKRQNTAPSFVKKISHILPNKIKDIMGFRNFLKKMFTRPIMTNKEKKWLQGLLYEDIQKLKSITNKSFAEWPEFN